MAMFQNSQWQVTDYGIETIPGASLPTIVGKTPEYLIDAKRLAETTKRGTKTFYDWPVHLAEKNWVDIALFAEAFTAALDAHKGKYSPPRDDVLLADSIAKALRIAAEE